MVQRRNSNPRESVRINNNRRRRSSRRRASLSISARLVHQNERQRREVEAPVSTSPVQDVKRAVATATLRCASEADIIEISNFMYRMALKLSKRGNIVEPGAAIPQIQVPGAEDARSIVSSPSPQASDESDEKEVPSLPPLQENEIPRAERPNNIVLGAARSIPKKGAPRQDGLYNLHPYSGNKTDEHEQIFQHLPKDIENYQIHEPFCGCASVSSDLNQDDTILNDADGDLMALKRVVRDGNGQIIVDFMMNEPKTKDTFDYWMELDGANDIEKAKKFAYTLIHSVNHFRERFGAKKDIPKKFLRELVNKNQQRFLEKASLTTDGFETSMRNNDRPNVMTIIDPPYPDTQGYPQEFPFTAHKRLAYVFKRMRCLCLMIVEDHPDMRRLYAGYIVGEYLVKRKAGKRKIVTHLVIRNYNLH